MIDINIISKQLDTSTALIILCLRSFLKKAAIEEIDLFLENSKVNWHYLFKSTLKHRVRPIVYSELLKAKVPITIKKRLRNDLMLIKVNNTLISKETLQIVNNLNDNNITALPYKGNAFSIDFYGEKDLRESSDIDIAINPNDSLKTIKILEKNGYLLENKEYFEALGVETYTKFNREFIMRKNNRSRRGTSIEFHWAPHPYYLSINKEQRFINVKTYKEISFLDSKIKTLSAEEHFKSVLFHHAVLDVFNKLKLWMDIAVALKKNNEKTSLINDNLNFIDFYKISYKIYALFGIETMENLSINGKEINLKSINIDSTSHQNHSSFLKRIIFNYNRLIIKSNYLKTNNLKLKYYLNALMSKLKPNEKDYYFLKLPKSLFFLYYFIRPLRLLLGRN